MSAFFFDGPECSDADNISLKTDRSGHFCIVSSFLHDPRTLQTARSDRWWNFPTSGRGLANAIGICVLLGGILALFMGWPVHTCEYFLPDSGARSRFSGMLAGTITLSPSVQRINGPIHTLTSLLCASHLFCL